MSIKDEEVVLSRHVVVSDVDEVYKGWQEAATRLCEPFQHHGVHGSDLDENDEGYRWYWHPTQFGY